MAQSDSPMPERRITDALLDEHDALRAAARRGEWCVATSPDGSKYLLMVEYGCFGEAWDWCYAEARFAMRAANDDAAMCAEVRRLRAVEKREAALLNLINSDWCERCWGSGNGPTQYDGGNCPGCEGAGLVPRAALAQPDEEAPR